MDKYGHIHTMEQYSNLKRNEVLTYFATWMNLESTLMKEGGHKDCLLCDSIYMKRPEEIKSRLVVVRGCWQQENGGFRGNGEGDFLRVQGSFGVKVF